VEAMTLADRVVVMNHGVIEQVGAPQELYHNPATRFVAGFIGSPAMNFLPCQLVDDGGLKVQLADGTKMAVPASRTDRYGPHKGKKLTLGIRPEHMTEVHDNEKPGVQRMNAKVDVVEPMGMETLVHHFVDGVAVHGRGYEQHAPDRSGDRQGHLIRDPRRVLAPARFSPGRGLL